MCFFFFFFIVKRKTAYELRIIDWSSDVCSSDLDLERGIDRFGAAVREEDAVESLGHQRRNALRQFEGQRMPELEGRREIEHRGGLGDGLGDLGPAMAGIAAPEPGGAVQNLAAVGTAVVHAARRHELARVRR